MSESILSTIRDGNLQELDSHYKRELDSYTNLYQQYLNKVAGNDDDKEAAEKNLKPQIIKKNEILINLAEIFLENNQRSSQLIDEDYKMIENKTKQLENLNKSFTTLNEDVSIENKEEEVKGQKKIENIQGVTGRNNIILTVLTVINILLLTFLVLGVVRITMLNKNL